MSEELLLNSIAAELGLKLIQVRNTVELLDDGNTVPFISRYRKEHTGSLDEDQIRAIQERMHYLRTLEARKDVILKSIEEQGKLTPELESKIKTVLKLQELEDLYLPYRPKKRTRATVARERGLQPLADLMLAQELETGEVAQIAAQYVNPEKEINTVEDALAGARDIVAETVSDTADVRRHLREMTFQNGMLVSEVRNNDAGREYEMYFEYREAVKSIPPHRVLAINRGEREGALRVSIEMDSDKIQAAIEKIIIRNRRTVFLKEIQEAIEDAYKRLIAPAIHREVRNELREKADEHAINVFAVNLRNLLLQPPVSGKIIMGIDPGFRTGCKIAVIDKTGKYLNGETIYPHPPQRKYFEAKSIVREMIEKYTVDLIAVGNGTASRETEAMIAELIAEIKQDGSREIYYTIVSEAGASVYSASKIARQEFPDLEASMRGNISIARRLLDPLAELVKIDPKSIGVGLYQHDVSQRKLTESLHAVVESCVNHVGVDVNTASASLLRYVSGLTMRSAENIVRYRDENGAFKNREQIKNVEGIGEIAFQQAAGFLRIFGGDNPLDATSIHPESYEVTQKLLSRLAIDNLETDGARLHEKIVTLEKPPKQLAAELQIGLPTLEDILENLEKPGRDPREEMPKPIFKSDVLKMEDLREGMLLKGTVRNVVDFGAFVDIGVKQDGLVHVSEMGERYVKNPLEVVAAGDVIEVRVLKIDLERERIALSMKIK